MNQILKSKVYGKGNRHHVNFIIDFCGLNEMESKVFRLLHEGKPDKYIEDEVGICKNTRLEIEESISAKLSIGIFACINKVMDLQEQ